MKHSPFSVVVLLLVLVSGCKTGPKDNYKQAYAADITDGKVLMATLRTLDTGDIRRTRQIAITSVHVTMSSLPDLAAKANATPEQKKEELALARDVLDYMIAHREDFNPRLPSVRMGVRGLQKILTQPEDVRRLTELSDYLAGVEKKLAETGKP